MSVNYEEKIKKEHLDKMPEYADKWYKVGFCTDPMDRERAEKAVRLAYTLAGREEPEHIIWCGSVLGNGIARLLIKTFHSDKDFWKSPLIKDAVDRLDKNDFDTTQYLNNDVYKAVLEEIKDDEEKRRYLADSVYSSVYGQHDAYWLSWYDLLKTECGLVEETEKLQGLWELSQSAGWVLPHDNVCFISDRPCAIHVDELKQLHNTEGPAIEYRDGCKFYAIHNIAIEGEIIEHPETLTLERLNSERNAEVRRVLMDFYTFERYLTDSHAVLIDNTADALGHPMRLYKIAEDKVSEEDIMILQVTNSTAEPEELAETTAGYVKDGKKYKYYYLLVPPHMTTAKQAQAWTIGRETGPEGISFSAQS